MRRWPLRLMPVLLVAWTVGPAMAQVDLTADPGRIRGPAQAPVTIVEFSDYE